MGRARSARGEALRDAIIAVLRDSWPTALTTGQVARELGSYDETASVYCNQGSDHERYAGCARWGWTLLECRPDFARVAREGIVGDREPVVHVLRRVHDSQTVGQPLTALAKDGRILLARSKGSRYWSAVADSGAAREITELERLLTLDPPEQD